ncbi:MAG: hypothetical protein HKN14_05965 [Marinicaulis sp.]|nr:hypothetical protein [Marinicaulis sp.]
MTLVFDSYLADVVFYGIVAIAGLFGLISIWLNWKSAFFRIIALAAIVLLLANPLLRQAERAGLKDIVLILIDETASHELDGRSRFANSAAEDVADLIDRAGDIEIRTSGYDGNNETRTIETLNMVLADTPRARLAGAFIITDGQTIDAETTFATEAPVHILTTGSNSERDRKITLTKAPRYGIVGNDVTISFRVDDITVGGAPAPDAAREAVVTLRIDGVEVVVEPVPIGTEASFRAPLERPGSMIIELEVEERDDELTTRNNVKILPITAIRDRLRVLLISGEPHPGERVWRNLLKSDPAVDLVHFTILRPIEKNDGTPVSELALIPFPQDELFIDKLSEFDLLIFDRYTYRGVLDSFHFDNIARYVELGGAVLIASGPEYSGSMSLAYRRNLSFILPASPEGGAIEQVFRPEVTDLGERHPVTAGLPEQDFWGRWMRIIPVRQEEGQTLMEGPGGRPLLILNRIKEGRVGMLLSDHVWLWARGYDGGGPHAELLRRIAHWLMKEPELEEEALSISTEGEDLIIRRRSVSTSPDPVVVTGPDGAVETLALVETAPGQFTTRIENAPSGLYRATAGELFAFGIVGVDDTPEFEDVVATGELLRPLAEGTGGGVFAIRDTGRISLPEIRRVANSNNTRAGADWAGIVERKATRIDSIKDKPLFHPAIWLAIAAGGMFIAWLIEGGKLRRSKA